MYQSVSERGIFIEASPPPNIKQERIQQGRNTISRSLHQDVLLLIEEQNHATDSAGHVHSFTARALRLAPIWRKTRKKAAICPAQCQSGRKASSCAIRLNERPGSEKLCSIAFRK